MVNKLQTCAPRFQPYFSLNRIRLIRALSRHPSARLRAYAIPSVRFGFRIGVRPDYRLQPSRRNYPSSTLDKLVITNWLINTKTIVGPFSRAQVINFIGQAPEFVAPLFTIYQGDKIRTISNFSFPNEIFSLNANLEPEFRTVEYPYFRLIVLRVRALGWGAWLWVIDAKDAYVQVPVHPADRKFLTIRWFGLWFVLCCLPFGLASSCKLYTEFADWIQWVLESENPTLFGDCIFAAFVLHYLDDFFGGSRDRRTAQRQFGKLFALFEFFDIPTTLKKCRSICQKQVMLGFEYNTRSQRVRVPDDKLAKILAEIDRFLDAPSGTYFTKKQYESLIGKLRWLASVIRVGRAFVRRLELYTKCLVKPSDKLKLIVPMRQDLRFWKHSAVIANRGMTFDEICDPDLDPHVTVYTDASGTIGYGGFCSDGAYFQKRWRFAHLKIRDAEVLIQFQELFAIVIACHLFGSRWRNRRVRFFCDNSNVVANVSKMRAHLCKETVMSLLRQIAWLSLQYEFTYDIRYVPGIENDTADDLSRFRRIRHAYLLDRYHCANAVHASVMASVEAELAEHRYGLTIT